VRDPVSGAWVPAHSIREALAFIEGVTDPLVKLSLADRLPPLLMGAYREYQSAARQYIEEALTKLGENEKQKAISVFTERYLSHGYPIDRKICKDVGLNVPAISDELENSICDLHEIYQDLLLEIQRRNTIRRFQKFGRAQDEEALYELEEGLLVIQADSKKSIVLNGRDITAEIERDLTQPQGTTGNPPS
jgi:hypothetical protein